MSRFKPSFWLFLGTKFPPILLAELIIFISSIPISINSVKRYEFFPYYVSLIVTAILAVVIRFFYEWKKFQELSSVFKNGVEVAGKIVNTKINWAAGYVEYEYQYQQGTYRCRYDSIRNKKTNKISVGQQVILYVNKENPWQAFIRDLYLNTF